MEPPPGMTSQCGSTFTVKMSPLSIPENSYGCCSPIQALQTATVVTLCFRGLLIPARNELLLVGGASSRASVLENQQILLKEDVAIRLSLNLYILVLLPLQSELLYLV